MWKKTKDKRGYSSWLATISPSQYLYVAEETSGPGGSFVTRYEGPDSGKSVYTVEINGRKFLDVVFRSAEEAMRSAKEVLVNDAKTILEELT